MGLKKKLPIEIENFEKIQTQGFYYADKTGLLIELLHNWGEVNLFTRPRRFGKSLNMSMLQTFFEIGCRKELFAGLKIENFCQAFPQGDAALIEKQLNEYLWTSISVRDTAVRTAFKENFYHGMLLGILQYEENWIVHSNEESGEGYSDLLIETPEGIGVVMELKYADDNRLDTQCAEALRQIEEKRYEARLLEDGMETVVKYGIAFYKKKCKVVTE